MRTLSSVLIMFMIACSSVTSQPTDNLKREEEFLKALDEAKATVIKAQEIQKAADQKTNQIVTETVNTITTLREEIRELKAELNEANHKLNSITDDNGVRFPLRPISGIEEDR